jgi:hypothetical protein
MTEVCPKIERVGAHEFGCVRAAGHPEGGCEFPIDATVYRRPLDTYDVAWLASEVRMLHGQIESVKREHRADQSGARLRRLIGDLIVLAPANGKRKTVLAEDVRATWQAAVNG